MNDETRLAKARKDVRISQMGRARLNTQVTAILLLVPSDGSGGVRFKLAHVESSFPDSADYLVYAWARSESGFKR